MILTLTPTDKVVRLHAGYDDQEGVEARVWEGTDDAGVELHVFITRVVVPRTADLSRFEARLGQEHPPPRNPDVVAYPARLVL